MNTNKNISRLQYITQDLGHMSHQELVKRACMAGINWVQLRVKNKSFEEYEAIALETKTICKQYNVTLIINDNVDVAKAVKANGVHLGKTDMDVVEARKLLGTDAIIGGTANTFEDIAELVSKGVDYIGLGPFKFTATKTNLSPLIGLKGYAKLVEQCAENKIITPIIAIGGIKVEDATSIIHTGVYGIAVSSAITFSENSTETVNDFKNEIGIKQKETQKL